MNLSEKKQALLDKLPNAQATKVYNQFHKWNEEEKTDKAIEQAFRIYQKHQLQERLRKMDTQEHLTIFYKQLAIATVVVLSLGIVGYFSFYPVQTDNIQDENEIKPNNKVITRGKKTREEPLKNIEQISDTTTLSFPKMDTSKQIFAKLFYLKRKPIKENLVFGGASDKIEFAFHLDVTKHLQDYPILQKAFEIGDYSTAKTALQQELEKQTFNSELQFFEVVLHLLSKQRIQPKFQLKKLETITLPTDFQVDVNWCKAYMYYTLGQKEETLKLLDMLNGTSYTAIGNRLKTSMK